MELTEGNVKTLMEACMAQTKEEVCTVVEGIAHSYGMVLARVAENEETIVDLLAQLPVEFHEATGGGRSFLNACNNREGRQWADLHMSMESLFVLGMAAGWVKCLLPRDMWKVLPGEMPYYMVTTEKFEVEGG